MEVALWFSGIFNIVLLIILAIFFAFTADEKALQKTVREMLRDERDEVVEQNEKLKARIDAAMDQLDP